MSLSNILGQMRASSTRRLFLICASGLTINSRQSGSRKSFEIFRVSKIRPNLITLIGFLFVFTPHIVIQFKFDLGEPVSTFWLIAYPIGSLVYYVGPVETCSNNSDHGQYGWKVGEKNRIEHMSRDAVRPWI